MSTACACWTDMWHVHDGHCCFDPSHDGTCHDGSEPASSPFADVQVGSMMASRYWLTEKGYAAVAAHEGGAA